MTDLSRRIGQAHLAANMSETRLRLVLDHNGVGDDWSGVAMDDVRWQLAAIVHGELEKCRWN
jgi:hypothetical protein